MKFLHRIKRRLARTLTAVAYRLAISLNKSMWKNHIKRWGSFISSGGKTAFELLCIILVILAVVLAVALFIAIFWRVFDWQGADWIDSWLGTSDLATAIKWETIKTLGQALLGLGLIVGIYVAYRRALASEETSKAQHNANEQQVFNEATAKLGDESASVRLGGIYALDKLASSNEAYLTRIVAILCAHLRDTAQQSNDEEDKKKDGEEGKKEDEKIDKKKYAEKYKDKPSNEIQSLLKVLAGLNQLSETKQEDRQSNPVRLELSGAYLVGANLENACLNRVDLSSTDIRKANLSKAKLQGAILENAKMQGAHLWGAQMQGARLVETQMQGANLYKTQIQRARLVGAQMQGARLVEAQMQMAILNHAQMQRASLGGAQMQRASLQGAQMQGAELWGAQMQGATLWETQMQGVDLHQAKMQGAVLFKTQLQGTSLTETQMQGAMLYEVQLQGADLHQVRMQGATLIEVDLRSAYVSNSVEHLNLPERIRKRQDKQTDLKTVIFSGGLKQEDARRIRKQLTEYRKNEWVLKEEVARINAILKEHRGKPINEEKPSGINTGSYDKKEADAIIAEYEKAIADVKENPSTD